MMKLLLPLFLIEVTAVNLAIAQTPSPSVPPVAAPKAPTVAIPTVSPPATPSSTSPHKPPTTTAAALIASAYNEDAFKKASTTGATVLLIFAGHGDPTWEKQAAALSVILSENEFRSLTHFQIDISSAELTERYAVKSAGTLLLMKDGFERLRSTRMTKPDVIRKMLRMNTLL